MPFSSTYRPAPHYISLADDSASGAPFFDPVLPADFPQSIIRYRNQRWAEKIGLDAISDTEWSLFFKGFEPLPKNLPSPLAIRYHGHQFRHYNPDLGDGRGFLYAQLRDDQGRLLDLGTKGTGQTPYSRQGDGRLTLKGGVREILATEMLEALGVYTSKTFSIIETGEALSRQDEPSPARSCVLVRLSHSHVRFGIFQRLAWEKNSEAIERLVDYCITHFYPGLQRLHGEDRILTFYEQVILQTARLAAQWMAAGFVHGVLNTDNMNVTGESFDYGPWRFISTVDPGFTAAYFDQTSLYAYGRQGEATGWNLAQLGGALTLLVSPEALTERLKTFTNKYDQAMANTFYTRLGLRRDPARITNEADDIMALLRWMTDVKAPFEQVMFDWFCGCKSEKRAKSSIINDLYGSETFKLTIKPLLDAENLMPDRLAHPYFEQNTPCTMLIDEVEAIWAAIAEMDDWQPLETKLADIASMREAYRFEGSGWPTPSQAR